MTCMQCRASSPLVSILNANSIDCCVNIRQRREEPPLRYSQGCIKKLRKQRRSTLPLASTRHENFQIYVYLPGTYVYTRICIRTRHMAAANSSHGHEVLVVQQTGGTTVNRVTSPAHSLADSLATNRVTIAVQKKLNNKTSIEYSEYQVRDFLPW